MDLIRNVLMDKKFFESIDEVEQLLLDHNIDVNSVIQKLIFDREIFPDEEDARLFAREHGFVVEEVIVTDKEIIIPQLDESEFIEDTLSTLEIRTGLKATVGVLKQDAVEGGPNDVFLSLRNDNIKLSGVLPHIIELARVVSGFHPAYGKVELTKEMLQSFAHNFNEGVVGVDLMIDYDHEQRGAAGWVKSVFVSNDGQTLFGEVKWTPKGALALSDREFRYFSPEFTLNYVHPHTGQEHGPTMLGGGLVNRPFLKMDAIVEFKETTNTNKEVEMTISLKEHNAIKNGLEKDVSDLKLTAEQSKNIVEGQKLEITKLSDELKVIKETAAKSEKDAKHAKLFSENKITKVQLDALNEGKDMYEVLSLGENMNTEPNGKGGEKPVVILSDADKAACKAIGVSEEDFVKYN